jgi:cell division protein FtsQ
VLADEEPKYLRRQKPVEIKRRKFGRKAWSTYLRVAVWAAIGAGCAWGTYEFGRFLLTAREMALVHPEQVALVGNHYVSRASVLEIFAADRGKSVLRIPLEERRRQIEAIPWVEHAMVRRALPNQIEAEISERTPVAFLREGSDMALVDVHGVILDRPVKGDFHFPVVTGLTEGMAPENREKRMQMFAGFLQQIESVHPGASEQVSEVDLTDAHDVRATLTGLPGGASAGAAAEASSGASGDGDAPLVVHFGDGDFGGKYETLVAGIGQWRATAGRVESVDLRYSREAVVNPDTTFVAQVQERPAKRRAARAARHRH